MLEDLNKDIGLEELKEALARYNRKSAQGEDEISFAAIKLMSDATLLHICLIFNACLRAGFVPGMNLRQQL